MKVKKKVEFKVDENGNKYPFVDIGSEIHGRRSFRLWVSGKLVEKKDGYEYICFPMRGRIEKTRKGNLVLKPSNDTTVYYTVVEAGYRGESCLEILSPDCKVFRFKEYRSPRGSLGISEGALIVSPNVPVKFEWSRTGRLYGKKESGVTIITPEGERKIVDDEELEEIKI